MSFIISYENFIVQLNCFAIKKIDFSVEGYSHYSHCSIQTKKDVLENGNIIPLINVCLTKDGKEDVSFYKTFNEKYKLFDMKKRGTYTLKQIWKKVIIHNIEYNQESN